MSTSDLTNTDFSFEIEERTDLVPLLVETNEPLSDADRRIMAFIQQTYFLTGQMPTDAALISALSVTKSDLLAAYKKDKFVSVLRELGIQEAASASEALSPEQVMCVNSLLNVLDKSSTREKLKVLGISTQKFNGWNSQPAFQNYMKERAEVLFAGAKTDAYLSVVKGVQSSDYNFTKLYLEMSNIYNPKLQVEVNVNMILTRVVEILTKHVSSEVLLEISNELSEMSPKQIGIAS